MLEKKTIVIYKSKSGFTKQYAKWIQEEIDCDVVDYKYVKKLNLEIYDVIIYGSGIHNGKIDGIKNIIKKLANHETSTFIVFATGGNLNSAEQLIEDVWKNSMTPDNLSSIPHFYMQSGLNYEMMSSEDIDLVNQSTISHDKKKEQSSLLSSEEAIENSYDESAKKYIQPLVTFVKGLV